MSDQMFEYRILHTSKGRLKISTYGDPAILAEDITYLKEAYPNDTINVEVREVAKWGSLDLSDIGLV